MTDDFRQTELLSKNICYKSFFHTFLLGQPLELFFLDSNTTDGVLKAQAPNFMYLKHNI